MIFINSSQKKLNKLINWKHHLKFQNAEKIFFQKVKFTLNNYNLFSYEYIILLPAQLRQQKGVSKK